MMIHATTGIMKGGAGRPSGTHELFGVLPDPFGCGGGPIAAAAAAAVAMPAPVLPE